MATAWQITSDNPAVRLPSRYQPLPFIVTAEPMAISVAFPLAETRRTEERAFRDGVFLWPYQGSTRAGNLFTLVREGGWPSDPKPFVDPTPPAISTFWTTLYERDLRALPTQAISGSGGYTSFTMDGVRWTFHHSSSTAAQVNGTGVTLTITSGRQLSIGQNAYAGLRLCVVASELPGFDSTKQTACLVRFSGVADVGKEFGATCWSGAEQWGYGPGNNNCTTKIVRVTGNTMYVKYATPNMASWDQVTNSVAVAATAEQSADWTTASVFEAGTAPSACQGYALRDGGLSFPVLESMLVAGAFQETGSRYGARHMGFYMGTVSGTKTLNATHIKVMQK
jgi:hypothetical protein